MAELAQKASQLRGLPLGKPLRVQSLSPAQMRALVERQLKSEEDRTWTPAHDDLFRLLGVIGPRERIGAVLRPALAAQVAGLYDPRTKRLYVVRAEGSPPPSSVIVHEATHALQDRRFDLSKGAFAADARNDDARLAAQAVVEGDATEVQTRYLAGAGLMAALNEAMGSLGQLKDAPAMPPFVERELTFPYIDGMAFIQALRRDGGQAAVDRAFRQPPRTTAAILDPERYLDGDAPAVKVQLPPPAPGAKRVLREAFGAEDLAALTGERDLAGSWRGGEVAVDRSGDTATLHAALAVDEPAKVAEALRCALPRGARVSSEGDLVRVESAATGRVQSSRC